MDVIFVGGGVIGLSGAWRAAEQGFRVSIVDPDPGRGASWVAAGMLAPVTEATYGEEELVRLLVAAAEAWPRFAADLETASGISVGYRRCGTVMVAVDASDRAVVDDLLAFQATLGLAARRLSASDCRRLVPALAPGVRGGAEIPGDHQVDNRLAVQALRAACERAGVRHVARKVVEVQTGPDGRVAGVGLEGGRRLDAPCVVLTAGADTTGIPGLSLPPIRPVKGQVVRLRGPRPLVPCTVRGLVHGRACYLVPRIDGSVIVGATSEERGFDRTVRAGAVRELLDDAATLVPGIDELELVECLAGLRPGTPDNGPFVGRTDVEGLLIAAGHYRNGVLLAPLTATSLGALIRGEECPGPLAGFGSDRMVVR